MERKAAVVVCWFQSPDGGIDVASQWVPAGPGEDIEAVFENFKISGKPIVVKARMPDRIPAGRMCVVAA